MNKQTSLVMMLGLLAVSVGCGASSPKSFTKRAARIGCKASKKCEADAWDAAGHDSVAECVDKATPEDQVEAFVDMCEDFDRGEARKCLAGMRAYRRTCDEDKPTKEQTEACFKVCGDQLQLPGPMGLDPADPESVMRMLEAAGQWADDEYDDDDVEPSPALSTDALAAP